MPASNPSVLAETPPRRDGSAVLPPLYVDLDGTLISSDLLWESLVLHLKLHPRDVFRLPAWLMRGRAFLKARLAETSPLDVTRLPYRAELCAALAREHARGRALYLATGADRHFAQKVADHLGFFDGVLASDGHINLTGEKKLTAIHARTPGAFSFAGCARADADLLRAAQSVLLVASPAARPPARLEAGSVEQRFPATASSWRAGVRALRLHHWVKNLLVFVPVFTSFRFVEARAVLQSGLAALAFCLCASAMYVVNDLFDIEADRAHPRKRARPFASGALPIPAGAALSLLCLALGLAVAAAVSPRLLGVIATYLAITTGYSLYFKRRVLLDVIVLAVLYTLRLLGGGVSSGISLSVWLIAFSLFTFLSLGLVKRCSELLLVQGIGRSGLHGRDYHFDDLRIFWPMGIAASVASVMVFAFYVQSGVVHAHYRTPALLWIVALGLFYWLSRMWIKTARGEMSDDPLVFAFTDFGSRTVIAGMIALTALAHFVALG